MNVKQLPGLQGLANGMDRCHFLSFSALHCTHFVTFNLRDTQGVFHTAMLTPAVVSYLDICIYLLIAKLRGNNLLIIIIVIIIIIIIYLTANGLSPGGSGYNACT